MRHWFAIGCLLAALVGTVRAQPARDDRTKAASRFKQGEIYFKAGDYDRAIAEYQAAYALTPEPLLLFNIALCNDRAQRPEQALEGFQHYLELAPDGEVAQEAREDVARLTPIVEPIRAKRAAEKQAQEAAVAEQARKVEAAHRADIARKAAEHERELAATASIEHRGQLERWGGIAVIGVGAVAIGIGIKFGFDARADGKAITDHTSGAWTDELLANDSAGHSANTKMIMFASIGGVCLLGGGVLYALGVHTHHEAERLQLGVRSVPAGDGATFVVSGRF